MQNWSQRYSYGILVAIALISNVQAQSICEIKSDVCYSPADKSTPIKITTIGGFPPCFQLLSDGKIACYAYEHGTVCPFGGGTTDCSVKVKPVITSAPTTASPTTPALSKNGSKSGSLKDGSKNSGSGSKKIEDSKSGSSVVPIVIGGGAVALIALGFLVWILLRKTKAGQEDDDDDLEYSKPAQTGPLKDNGFNNNFAVNQGGNPPSAMYNPNGRAKSVISEASLIQNNGQMNQSFLREGSQQGPLVVNHSHMACNSPSFVQQDRAHRMDSFVSVGTVSTENTVQQPISSSDSGMIRLNQQQASESSQVSHHDTNQNASAYNPHIETPLTKHRESFEF